MSLDHLTANGIWWELDYTSHFPNLGASPDSGAAINCKIIPISMSEITVSCVPTYANSLYCGVHGSDGAEHP